MPDTTGDTVKYKRFDWPTGNVWHGDRENDDRQARRTRPASSRPAYLWICSAYIPSLLKCVHSHHCCAALLPTKTNPGAVHPLLCLRHHQQAVCVGVFLTPVPFCFTPLPGMHKNSLIVYSSSIFRRYLCTTQKTTTRRWWCTQHHHQKHYQAVQHVAEN